jgi:hypothetical protein
VGGGGKEKVKKKGRGEVGGGERGKEIRVDES